MTFARLRLARVRETMFPSLAPFFEEIQRGNRPVPPESPLPSHGPEAGP